MAKSALITGSCGLIGSEVCIHLAENGYRIFGVDNNERAVFFGPEGDTSWSLSRLKQNIPTYSHASLDIRDRTGIGRLLAEIRPGVIVHTAAQPSHDRAASIPFDDFDTNAVGTLNLLEAARRACPESPFVHMSTNKVYGDLPNSIAMRELPSRWDYDDARFENGISETFSIDQSKHSLFGRLQSSGRRDGAGIRPLLQHAHLCFTRRLSHGAESLRRGTAWLPQLPGAVQRGRP